ncbi:ADP-ribosylation factor-binding protein GGA1 isoform X1 [Macrobrachium rosenbergii]|uniref:ADP-ribosylation factor-binding protein GGA1 isoform X1 n=2 Tax=Macrobrachium rosenbergii TaxID=79674 RepID=UPI0034D675B9
MATAAPTLEALIQKSTNPLNVEDDPNAIQAVCHAVTGEPGGIQTAVRLIAHKIQSPQEREALQALSVLQACVNNCGPAFHAEIGKFRFLNEMIKLVSPKYLGNHTHVLVKTRVVELLFTWTIDLKEEPKILEAYNMLKKQGVIKDDPSYIGAPSVPEPRSRTNAVFEDEEKSLLLKKLLKSKNPDDLHKANALIKSMVKEDERRMERTSRRIVEVETAMNNVRVLDEMLSRHQETPAGQADLDLMSELHSSCSTLRSNLYRLVSDMDDKEEGIGDLLKANDELSRVMGRYKLIVEGTRLEGVNSHSFDTKGAATPNEQQKDGEILLDLSTPEEAPSNQGTTDLVNKDLEDIGIGSLNLGQTLPPSTANSIPSSQLPGVKNALDDNSTSVLDDLESIFPTQPPAAPLGSLSLGSGLHTAMAPTLVPETLCGSSSAGNQADEETEARVDPLEDLAALGTSLIKQNLPANVPVQVQFKPQEKMTLNQMKEQNLSASAIGNVSTLIQNKSAPIIPSSAPTSTLSANLDIVKNSAPAASSSPTTLDLLSGDLSISLSSETKDSTLLGSSDESILDEKPPSAPVINVETKDIAQAKPAKNPQFMEVKPMNDIKVSLDSIKPGKQAPVTVIESNDITMNLHFTENQPRDDVSVVVVSTMSRCSMPISNYVVQAVVPKGCKVRLQPPSSTELAAFSPFLPPPAITQIMLIANPNKLNISLKVMLSYTMDEDPITEMGEIASLPL